MQSQGQERPSSNPRGVPATDDEIREKYLERAIRELNALTRELQACPYCARGYRFSIWTPVALQWNFFLSRNWSVFGEWDYMNFDTHNLTFTDPTFGSTQVSVKQQINVLKMGINYRFGNTLPQQYP